MKQKRDGKLCSRSLYPLFIEDETKYMNDNEWILQFTHNLSE